MPIEKQALLRFRAAGERSRMDDLDTLLQSTMVGGIVPHGAGALVPHAGLSGIAYIEAIGSSEENVIPVPDGSAHDLDLVNRGRVVDRRAHLPEPLSLDLAVVLGGEALGGAERLLTDTVDYVKNREQFGRPVGSFQAVKHKIANATIAVESAETALIWASQVDADTFRTVLFGIDRCIDVAETAIQTHGGLGFTWEVGLHFPHRTMLSNRRIVAQLGETHV